MAETRHPAPPSGPDKYQLDARQDAIDAAKRLPLLDAVWKVVFYNRHGYLWGCSGPPYPDLISFDEIDPSWTESMLAPMVSRAVALYDDAYRIGDLHHRAKFDKETCQKAVVEFKKMHPGYTEQTYNDAITYGCVLSR